VFRQDNPTSGAAYAGWIFGANPPGVGESQSYAYTHAVGAVATFRFSGTSVVWKTVKGPDMGLTDVYLDGKKVKTFDGFTPGDYQLDVTGYKKQRLRKRAHTLKLVSTGRKNPSATDTFTAVERFVVGARSFEGNDPNIAYGPWRGVRDDRASGGTYRESASTLHGAYSFPFTGTEIGLVTATGPTRGKSTMVVVDLDTATVARSATFDLEDTVTRWGIVKKITGLDAAKRYSAVVTPIDGKPLVVDGFSWS
jgi:hypothetical protein